METAFWRKWTRISLLSLAIVALLGCMMRYKIAFALPWFPQKNVLHAHSHFAFAGWLSQILMLLMVRYLKGRDPNLNLRLYNRLLWANILTAWGMLCSFPLEGYGPVSIFFSTSSIVVSYVFAVVYWRNLNRLPEKHVSALWFKAALVWNMISAIGPLLLAYRMVAHMSGEHAYLATIYFFLHFQYNGWFFFACAGLLFGGNTQKEALLRPVFYALAIACVPAYLLSVLWARLPAAAFAAAGVSVVLQLLGWGGILWLAGRGRIPLLQGLSSKVRLLFWFAAVAGTVKFLLQAGSLHPVLAKLAFGFRPIVIAYLHLVLLGLLTLFLLAYLKQAGLILRGGLRRQGLLLFVSGLVLQEALLLAQGALAIAYQSIPYINEALFGSALIMLVGLVLLNVGMSGQRLSEVPAAGEMAL